MEEITETGEQKQKFSLAEVYKELIRAFEDDKRVKEELKAAGIKDGDPNASKVLWAKKYWWLIAVFIFIMLSLVGAEKPRRRSHHGYNSRGERY